MVSRLIEGAETMTYEQKKEFFVGYDYGMGGLWFFIWASSLEEITEKYPNIPVWENVPDWMFVPAKSDKRFTDEMRDEARRNKPKLLASLRKFDTYNINNIAPHVHNVLLGEGFQDFIVEVQDATNTAFFVITAFNKEEILGRYPKLHIHNNMPGDLKQCPDFIEETHKNKRYHIQNIPEDIDQFFSNAR